MILTPKQEAFAAAVASGKNQSDAYRAAYNVGKNTKAETVWKRSSELMANGAVAGRVAELRKPAMIAAGMTLESHLSDLLKLRNLAAKDTKWGAAIQAEIARGRAAGIVIERHDINLTTHEASLDELA